VLGGSGYEDTAMESAIFALQLLAVVLSTFVVGAALTKLGLSEDTAFLIAYLYLAALFIAAIAVRAARKTRRL